jgi:DNA-binding HxlR family transcriptional regulator
MAASKVAPKSDCDVEVTLAIIGGLWKPVLLWHLIEGRRRFGELCRLVPRATQRIVTLHLRELEADGLISRHVYAEIPPRVEYDATDLGRSLMPVLAAMRDWGLRYREETSSASGVDGAAASRAVPAPVTD